MLSPTAIRKDCTIFRQAEMFEIYAKKQKLIWKNGSDDGKVVPTITKSLFQLKKMFLA